MKHKVKIVCAICFAFAITICAILCSGAGCENGPKLSFEEAFESNWKVVLPTGMQKLFSESEKNWGHFGIRYAVFELEEEPSEFISDFEEEHNAEFENKVSNLLDRARIDIPEEYLPDWSKNYCWKILEKEYYYSEDDMVIDTCYMMYFYESKELSICQYFV